MKTLHLVLLAITCFCTVDFILIQSEAFVQCKPVHDAYGAENLSGCEQTSEHVQFLFGFTGSIAIAFMVGIITVISRKKGAILALSLAALAASFVITYQIMLSTTAMPVGVMRETSMSYLILMDFVRSPLWAYVFIAAIFGAIAWPISAFRNKIVRIR